MQLPTGHLAYVWEDRTPGSISGFSAPLVRAANGSTTRASDGADFSAVYNAWAKQFGDEIDAWSYFYPSSDPNAAAEALINSAPKARTYSFDIEDRVSPDKVRALYTKMRELRPGVAVGFSSYPSREQAIRLGVPWDTLIEVVDFSRPQVYWPNQRKVWAQIVADHKGVPIFPALSPGDDPNGVWAFARQIIEEGHQGICWWRYPMTQQWESMVRALPTFHSGDAPTAPPPTAPAPKYQPEDGDGLLAQWEQGPSVADLQRKLGIPADGYFGPQTESAVEAYQASHGLAVDGIAGPKTLAVLNAPSRPQLAVDGDMGPATVSALQRAIGAAVDGIMGPATKRALQSRLGVAVDGVVGPITVRALQRRVGAKVDGDWGADTTRHLQVALNEGKF